MDAIFWNVQDILSGSPPFMKEKYSVVVALSIAFTTFLLMWTFHDVVANLTKTNSDWYIYQSLFNLNYYDFVQEH